MNIKLSHIVEHIQRGNFYDWTRDFDTFKTTLNSTTESAKTKFEKSLSGKILNKSVIVRASKGYKQPVKDYTIKRVTHVNINDFYDDWVVVLKNEFNKEYFLTAGYKIKIVGRSVAQEPGSADVPAAPEPTPKVNQELPQKNPQPVRQQRPPQQPNPLAR
jgi:hypothetical protein